MTRLDYLMERVSAGDTLRDTAGNFYLVRGFIGHGAGAQMQVTRLSDQQERDVYVDTAWAMMEGGHLWKAPAKKARKNG
jgi:hypothetical protein